MHERSEAYALFVEQAKFCILDEYVHFLYVHSYTDGSNINPITGVGTASDFSSGMYKVLSLQTISLFCKHGTEELSLTFKLYSCTLYSRNYIGH